MAALGVLAGLLACLASARRCLAVCPFRAAGLGAAAFLTLRPSSEPRAAALRSASKLVPLTRRNSMRRASRSTRDTCTCTLSVRR
ncbi:Uncharacterised protein [Bordetella pertussis]|nr:Uncharacterised protein [Bordetella pertussis]